MKTFWIANIIFFALLELYSVGVMFAAKRCGEKDYKKSLIPFYSFYLVRKIVNGFSVMTIPVRKYHVMFLELYLVAAGALLYACWGSTNLPEISASALWEIMAVPIGISVLTMYGSLLVSSQKVYRRFRVEHEGRMTLLSAPLVTIPLLYWLVSKREPRLMKDMY